MIIFVWITIMFISLLILYAVTALGSMIEQEFMVINETLISLIKHEVGLNSNKADDNDE